MKSRISPAFTLLEVALALSMVAFALITTLGLLPVGLQAMRSSAEETVATRIFQTVSSRLRNEKGTPDRFYFDSNGREAATAIEGGFVAEVVPMAVTSGAVDARGRQVRVDVFFKPSSAGNYSPAPLATSRLILLP